MDNIIHRVKSNFTAVKSGNNNNKLGKKHSLFCATPNNNVQTTKNENKIEGNIFLFLVSLMQLSLLTGTPIHLDFPECIFSIFYLYMIVRVDLKNFMKMTRFDRDQNCQ